MHLKLLIPPKTNKVVWSPLKRRYLLPVPVLCSERFTVLNFKLTDKVLA